MTTITKQTQHPIDLEKYKIDLGPEFGKNFYWDYLNELPIRRRAELFGYECLRTCSTVDLHRQNGQYNTSRFLKACKGLHINPHGIFSNHQSKVLQMIAAKRSSRRWVEVSEELKEAVLNKICDDYDNKS
jgi:hypothetical protein